MHNKLKEVGTKQRKTQRLGEWEEKPMKEQIICNDHTNPDVCKDIVKIRL